MTAELPTVTDVLVVGAGPTGLALSTALRLLGVDVVTVDAAGSIRTESRAAGVQPRTLEDLARLGAADDLVDRGIRGRGFRAVNGRAELLSFSFADLDTPYPYVLLVPQNESEQVLRDALDTAGGVVLREFRVLGLDPEFDGVAVTVAGPDGVVHAVRARYVVGCDGLHSGVRGRVGIGFSGSERSQRYLLADAAVDGLDGPPQVTFTFAAAGLLLLSPLPGGLLRIVATVPDEGQDFDRAAIQRLLDARAPAGAMLTVTSVEQVGPYRVSTRLADAFRSERVFLAGDAAHVHSPAGGQGMNTGIQDAVNLAWKLAAVVLDGADDALLDTYEAERRPNAAGLLAFTGQLTGLAELTAPPVEDLRDQVLHAVASVPGVAPFLAGRLSQLDIRYPQPAGRHPLVGTRLPPRAAFPPSLQWTLIVPDRLRADAESLTAGSPVVAAGADDTAVLVRPDGYVDEACDGAGPDDLRVMLARLPGRSTR